MLKRFLLVCAIVMSLMAVNSGVSLAFSAPGADGVAVIDRDNQDGGASLMGLCNYSGGHPVLRQGSTGAAVSHAQCLLRNYHGYTYISADGIFGAQTNSAVRDFQARKGLVVDGIIGCATWSKLHPDGGC